MSDSVLSRRDVLKSGAATGVALAASYSTAKVGNPTPGTFISISSGNGMHATERAVELMKQGADVVEAAVEGVVLVELDPNDMSVGYGGLPNELGVVELDSCVMHGPTMRAGSVGGLQNIKTPSRVARMVMERTDHVMLVGAGALAFAKAMGFKEEDLMTDKSRAAWLSWKTRLSKADDWLDDEDVKNDFGERKPMEYALDHRPTGTINCLTLNDKGELGGCTSTSGLAWKIPGRVGDSPIIGAGLYVDGEVGGAGSTGRGEANIQVGGGRIVVENMRHGMTPEEAVLDVLKRVCDQTHSPRLLKSPGKPNFALQFYALRKDGKHAAGTIYKGGSYSVNDGSGASQKKEMIYLYES